MDHPESGGVRTLLKTGPRPIVPARITQEVIVLRCLAVAVSTHPELAIQEGRDLQQDPDSKSGTGGVPPLGVAVLACTSAFRR
jgi:hypothetical protein